MVLQMKNLLHLNIEQLERQDFDEPESSEVTPRVEHYLRKFHYNFVSRPTVESLHRSSVFTTNDPYESNKIQKTDACDGIKDEDKFGLFSMVYVPTFMNLLGTTLYLRMGLVVGEAGILLALLQVLIGAIILTLTVLSMSAICTNGDVGNGGFYFLISRSLGPEIGAMFGCVYFLTNAIMVSFSIIGVCLEVQFILQSLNTAIFENPSGLNDQRIVGLITLVVVSFIPFISLEFEAKSQWFLFGIVILSLLDFYVGLIIPPTDYQKAHGIVGWDKQVIITNLLPQFNTSSFFAIFSLYVSTIAGDFTGMTMSSTLKKPNVDIPKGSILAIITTTVVYVLQIIFFGCTAVRYSSGNVFDVKFNSKTCDPTQECNFGLIPDQYIMSRASALTIIGDRMHYIEPIFAAGILAQSLSSAMSSFISAPRILQSLGFDELLPLAKWFAKGTGKHADPLRGYVLTFIIAVIFIAIADFDIIANVISNCYLCAWFLLNIAVFHSDYVRSPNWRPTFRYYNKWLSLLCAIICFALMFCFDWISSLCLLVLMSIIWIIIYYYKPDVSWGQTTDSQLYKTTVSFAHKLNMKLDHVKNFRPSVLLLCGIPKKHLDLISIANDITRHRGMLVIGDVDVESPNLLYEKRYKTIAVWNNWLNQQKIKCFYRIILANSISEGSNMMIQCCGLGSQLSPNIVMIGFKEFWKQSTHEEVVDYFNVIHNALRMQMSLTIYRNNVTNSSEKTSETDITISSIVDNNKSIEQSSVQLTSYQMSETDFRTSNFPRAIESSLQSNFIDIYWLYDDGGLTLLIPYLLSQRKNWRKNKLRIFCVVDSYSNSEEQNLKELLQKFRIDYSDIIVLEYPRKHIFKSIEQILVYIEDKSLFFDPNSKKEITESFYRFEAKTNKYIGLRQLLEHYSNNSSLIVMTIEIPKKDVISAHLFMYWLDILSSNMPQFLFIRGNQKNVLTFYCD